MQLEVVARSADGGLIVEDDGMPGGTMPLLVGSNFWVGQRNGQRLQVSAGNYSIDRQPYPTTDDPRYIPTNGPPAAYGALMVFEYGERGEILREDIYPTPLPVGHIAIVDVQEGQFLLRAATGDSFVFDVDHREYIGITGAYPTDRDWKIGPWFAEVAPRGETEVPGYHPYATWVVHGGGADVALTGYVSDQMWGGAAVMIRSGTDEATTLVPVPGPYQGAMRPVAMDQSGMVLLYTGRSYPLALDMRNARLLDEDAAIDLMREVRVPYDRYQALNLPQAIP
ncbi:MAG TPA: hypothetical protein PLC98_16140 [Anaerolineales bacterium]|nr:hypothetical protein [Anaerolineales bacterium]